MPITSPRKAVHPIFSRVPLDTPPSGEQEHRRLVAEAVNRMSELVLMYPTQVVAVTAAYTLQEEDGLVNGDASGGAFSVTLQSAKGREGRVVSVKNTGASGTVTIDGDGSETIDGATTVGLTSQYAFRTMRSDGSNWHVIGTG